MKSVRERLTYANVVATIALFIALAGGTAFAASLVLPKNSVGARQLKNGAVTPTKLSKAAKQTLTGSAGPQGKEGKEGPQGKEGPRGERGEPGPAVQILPSGQTEAGVWSGAAPSGSVIDVSINFVPKLQQPVPATNEIYLKAGETKPHCPGFGKADPGFLCVYAAWENSVAFSAWLSGFSEETGVASSVVGTVFSLTSSSALANARGNWAYTAP